MAWFKAKDEKIWTLGFKITEVEEVPLENLPKEVVHHILSDEREQPCLSGLKGFVGTEDEFYTRLQNREKDELITFDEFYAASENEIYFKSKKHNKEVFENLIYVSC